LEEKKLTQAELLIKLGEYYLDEGYFEFAIDAFTQATD
jgi:cytochrome c-type biogenesis protein CcmH/NrfG